MLNGPFYFLNNLDIFAKPQEDFRLKTLVGGIGNLILNKSYDLLHLGDLCLRFT